MKRGGPKRSKNLKGNGSDQPKNAQGAETLVKLVKGGGEEKGGLLDAGKEKGMRGELCVIGGGERAMDRFAQENVHSSKKLPLSGGGGKGGVRS